MKLICIGDSLTFSPGIRRAWRWTELAAEMSGWELVNMGVSGDTAVGMLSRLRSQILSAPGVAARDLRELNVFIMGGVNDILFTGTDVTARSALAAMVHELSALGATAVVGIPPAMGHSGFPEAWRELVDFGAAAEKLREYQNWLETFCRTFAIPVVDFRPCFTDRFGNERDELFIDGLHPGADGQMLMAETLSAFLKNFENEA